MFENRLIFRLDPSGGGLSEGSIPSKEEEKKAPQEEFAACEKQVKQCLEVCDVTLIRIPEGEPERDSLAGEVKGLRAESYDLKTPAQLNIARELLTRAHDLVDRVNHAARQLAESETANGILAGVDAMAALNASIVPFQERLAAVDKLTDITHYSYNFWKVLTKQLNELGITDDDIIAFQGAVKPATYPTMKPDGKAGPKTIQAIRMALDLPVHDIVVGDELIYSGQVLLSPEEINVDLSATSSIDDQLYRYQYLQGVMADTENPPVADEKAELAELMGELEKQGYGLDENGNMVQLYVLGDDGDAPGEMVPVEKGSENPTI
jgi:hypothetical protein